MTRKIYEMFLHIHICHRNLITHYKAASYEDKNYYQEIHIVLIVVTGKMVLHHICIDMRIQCPMLIVTSTASSVFFFFGYFAQKI